MAEIALGTIPLFIRFFCFPLTSRKEETQPQILAKRFAFLFKFYNFPWDRNGYVFFLIIHLLETGTHVKSKKKFQIIQCIIQRKNICLMNARQILSCPILSMEVTMLPIQRGKMLIGMVVCFPLYFFAEVGMVQGSFPLLNLTDLKEVSHFKLVPNCAYFSQAK